MDRLLEILNNVRPDLDFEKEENLVSDLILDSFDIVSIVGAISDEFSIDISVEDLIPDNFDSAGKILDMVRKKQGK